MTITEIRQTSPGRMTVQFDDGSEIKSTLSVITDLMLFSGKEIDESGLELFKTASVRSLTLERSIEYISRRMMSSKELHDKLLEKGYSEDIAEYCVNKLSDLGLLNDRNYAMSLARHYSSKGYGSSRIRSELFRHGVPKEYFEEAVDSVSMNEDKIHRIIASKLKDPGDKTQIKRISDALYRRGFSWDEIKSAIKDYIDELEE